MSKSRILLYKHIQDSKNNLLESLMPVLSEDYTVQQVGVDEKRNVTIDVPNDTVGAISLGIGNGSDGLIDLARREGINYYLLDRAYFNPWDNKSDTAWCRFTKNKLVENTTGQASPDRYELYHAERHPVLPWRDNVRNGDVKTILVLPPAYMDMWFYNAWNWLDHTIEKLNGVLSVHDRKLIKVRYRPTDFKRNHDGHKVGFVKTKQKYTAEEDLRRAGVAIAYNTSMALDAVMMGIPVITDQFSSAAPLSSSLDDIRNGGKFPYDIPEPVGRREHAWWLSYKQFNRNEIKDGTAWRAVR